MTRWALPKMSHSQRRAMRSLRRAGVVVLVGYLSDHHFQLFLSPLEPPVSLDLIVVRSLRVHLQGVDRRTDVVEVVAAIAARYRTSWPGTRRTAMPRWV
jgi:hypothetical protein